MLTECFEAYQKLKYDAMQKMYDGKIAKMTPKERSLFITHISEYPTFFNLHLKLDDELKSSNCYLLTFTLNPKRTSKSSIYEIDDYVKKTFLRAKLNILKAYYVQEGGKTTKKAIHWHVSCCTSNKLNKDDFRHYIRTIGNVDISYSKTNDIYSALNYISKQNIPTRII